MLIAVQALGDLRQSFSSCVLMFAWKTRNFDQKSRDPPLPLRSHVSWFVGEKTWDELERRYLLEPGCFLVMTRRHRCLP